MNNACYNFGWRRDVGGGIERSSQGIWRPTVMVCVRRIIFASALLALQLRLRQVAIVAQRQMMSWAIARMQKLRSNNTQVDRSHMRRPCASLCGQASHSRRGLRSDPADVIMRHRNRSEVDDHVILYPDCPTERKAMRGSKVAGEPALDHGQRHYYPVGPTRSTTTHHLIPTTHHTLSNTHNPPTCLQDRVVSLAFLPSLTLLMR